MYTLQKSIERTQDLIDCLDVDDLSPMEPTLQYVWVHVGSFKPTEDEEWSIQVNPFHRLPIRILRQLKYPCMKSAKFIELYPSLIHKILAHLLMASDHIPPAVGCDPNCSEVEPEWDWRVLKTRVGKFEFVPVPGDPREVIEIYAPKREPLLIAKSAIPTLANGLLRALCVLQQMHPACDQLELIFGKKTGNLSSCLPVQEAW